jgi:hypothetical protein
MGDRIDPASLVGKRPFGGGVRAPEVVAGGCRKGAG